MNWKLKQVKISTESVRVMVVGKGQAIVILHGWGSNFVSWKKASQVLGQKFQVFVLELPGFGRTPEPKTAWNVSEYADWIDKLIQKLKLDRVILLGHSNGGRIGICLASRQPEWLEKLILMNLEILEKEEQSPKNLHL